MRLKGKVAIVTGSTRGIGKAIAKRLGEEGASVVINGRDKEQLIQTAEEIRSMGVDVLAVKADVTRIEEVKHMSDETLKRFKRVDILVSNVGGEPTLPGGKTETHTVVHKDVDEIPLEEWDTYFDFNLNSVFLCVKAIVPHMKERQQGKIIIIASRAGRAGSVVTSGAYVCSKAGVLGLAKQLGLELAPYGINCNAIAPGSIVTEYFEQVMPSMSEEQKNRLINMIPMKRHGKPDEVASVAAFLASDDASYITSVIIDVNGGSYIAP